jgi:hypothetical protein
MPGGGTVHWKIYFQQTEMKIWWAIKKLTRKSKTLWSFGERNATRKEYQVKNTFLQA